jgi:hypothetical protein
MATSHDILAKARDLIHKGDVAGARAALDEPASDLPKGATAAAAVAPAPVKRPVPVVMLDLFKGIHNLLGNNPAILPLINELTELIAEEQPAVTPTPVL